MSPVAPIVDWVERALRPLSSAAREDAGAIRLRCLQLARLLPAEASMSTQADGTRPAAPPRDGAALTAWHEYAGHLHARAVAHLSRVQDVQAVFARNLRLFESVEIALASFTTRTEAERALDDVPSLGRPIAGNVPPEPEPIASLPLHGYAGLVMRGDLPISLAEAAFTPRETRVCGPVRHAGRYWLVERLMPPTPVMNEGTYEWCEDMLVEQAIARTASRQ